jgi:hypothetical protein
LVTGTVASTSNKKSNRKIYSQNIQLQLWLVMMRFLNYASSVKQIKLAMGAAVIPSINYDKADVIVGFNADFLGTGISNTENTKKVYCK